MVRWARMKRTWRHGAGALLTLLMMAAGAVFWYDQTHALDLSRYEARSLRVTDAAGDTLRIYPVENGRIRLRADLDTIDPGFIAMLTAYEDKRFFTHTGMDARAMARALWQAVSHGEVISGASTLSMQTARLLAPQSRTVSAKFTEIIHAWQLERRFSKREILEIYLTLAPYGGNIEGIEAASQIYFGHRPDHLSPHEAALLVALPQSPTRLRPDRAPADARLARNKVLNRVADRIGLDPHVRDIACKAPVPGKRHDLPLIAPHYTDRVSTPFTGTDTLSTSLDRTLQVKLERLAARAAARVHANASAAILVVDNRSRKILAYVGSAGTADQNREGFVDMVAASRSPGSTLKPFIYGMAFDRGLARPQTLIRDEVRDFGGYKPANFMDRHYGEISVTEALRRSLNVPAVAVLDRLGAMRFTEHLRDTGVRLDLPGGEKPGLAVALGGVGMSLEDLVGLYAALADDGMVRSPFTNPPTGTELMSPASRADITHILRGMQAPEDRVDAGFIPNPRTLAYKTGTSYGFRDTWAIGYNRDVTIGVWLGRPDGTPLPGHFGSNTAAPVLFSAFELMPAANLPARTGNTPDFASLPPGLKYFDRPQRIMTASAHTVNLRIDYPGDNSLVEPGPDGTLMLAADGGVKPLQWFVNGVPKTQNRWAQATSVRLTSNGFYRIVLVDAAGNRAAASIQVRQANTVSAPENTGANSGANSGADTGRSE